MYPGWPKDAPCGTLWNGTLTWLEDAVSNGRSRGCAVYGSWLLYALWEAIGVPMTGGDCGRPPGSP